jgi:HEAT repeat protein
MLMRKRKTVLRIWLLALAAGGFLVAATLFLLPNPDDQADVNAAPLVKPVRLVKKTPALSRAATTSAHVQRETLPGPCKVAMSDKDAVGYYASLMEKILADPQDRSSEEQQEDERLQREAALELKQRGPMAAPAVQILIRSLKSDRSGQPRRKDCFDVPEMARAALVSIGQKAVPALKKALYDKDPLIRVHAARALWELEGNADQVLPVLWAAWLADGENIQSLQARTEAVRGVARIGPKKKDLILPGLRSALEGSDDNVAWAAAFVLFEIAPDVPEALPPLLAALTGPRSATIKRCAVFLTDQRARAVPVLARALDDDDARVRAWAAAALGETHQSEAVPLLVKTAADPEVSVRQSAVYGLYELYGDAAPAVPALRKLLDDPDAEVRRMARQTLERLGE